MYNVILVNKHTYVSIMFYMNITEKKMFRAYVVFYFQHITIKFNLHHFYECFNIFHFTSNFFPFGCTSLGTNRYSLYIIRELFLYISIYIYRYIYLYINIKVCATTIRLVGYLWQTTKLYSLLYFMVS